MKFRSKSLLASLCSNKVAKKQHKLLVALRPLQLELESRKSCACCLSPGLGADLLDSLRTSPDIPTLGVQAPALEDLCIPVSAMAFHLSAVLTPLYRAWQWRALGSSPPVKSCGYDWLLRLFGQDSMVTPFMIVPYSGEGGDKLQPRK